MKNLAALVAMARKAFVAAIGGAVAWAAVVQASADVGVTDQEWLLLIPFVLVPGLAVYATPNKPAA